MSNIRFIVGIPTSVEALEIYTGEFLNKSIELAIAFMILSVFIGTSLKAINFLVKKIHTQIRKFLNTKSKYKKQKVAKDRRVKNFNIQYREGQSIKLNINIKPDGAVDISSNGLVYYVNKNIDTSNENYSSDEE